MSDPIIVADKLTKAYGTTIAVDQLDLAIEQGEVFGLLGPNGAGKTTTILMMLGLTEPTSGRATVAGFDPLRQPLEVKRRVGYMPDQVGFYDNLSGVVNLRYTARLAGIPRREIDHRIAAALERVGLTEFGRNAVKTYSRGMRQRLAIAEILMKQARVAILDEPTGGLDPQATREFLDLVRSLKQDGMTILLSSHLLDLVQSVCDRVALFNVGKIGLIGGVNDLLREVLGGSHVIRVEATGRNLEHAISAVPGVKRVTAEGATLRVEAAGDLRPQIARAVIEAGGELMTIAAGHASLEEVYTQYFRGIREQEGVRHAA
jgi:ABC-2 type transport system ATP-binding protein